VCKFFANGSTQDTAYNANLGTGIPAGAAAQVIVAQSDDKVIIGGNFVSFNGNGVSSLVRLNANGTEDTTFTANLGTGFSAGITITSIHIQADGKILVGGNFSSFNGNTRNLLIRLNSDGTEDTAFYTNLGAGFNGIPYAIQTNSAGKIFIGGSFSVPDLNLTCLNSDGTRDTAIIANFAGGPTGQVLALAVQSDDKVIVAGAYSTWNTWGTRNRILRLNANGTEDAGFYTNLGTAANSTVQTVSVDGSGNVYFGGLFNQINGVTKNRYAKTDSSGVPQTYSSAALDALFSSLTIKATAIIGTRVLWGAWSSFGPSYGVSYNTFFSTGQVNNDFVCPAGVTQILIQPTNDLGVATSIPNPLTVVPNTTYVVTINSTTYAFGTQNTFGALYSWAGGGFVKITFVE